MSQLKQCVQTDAKSWQVRCILDMEQIVSDAATN